MRHHSFWIECITGYTVTHECLRYSKMSLFLIVNLVIVNYLAAVPKSRVCSFWTDQSQACWSEIFQDFKPIFIVYLTVKDDSVLPLIQSSFAQQFFDKSLRIVGLLLFFAIHFPSSVQSMPIQPIMSQLDFNVFYNEIYEYSVDVCLFTQVFLQSFQKRNFYADVLSFPWALQFRSSLYLLLWVP